MRYEDGKERGGRSATASFAVFLLLSYGAAAGMAAAAEYQRQGPMVGRQMFHRAGSDDSLYEIARSYDIGINAIIAANPRVDEFLPDPGIRIVVPSYWILPDVPVRRGIVINRAEMRLYLFPENGARSVISFPVGVGDIDRDTPLGTFRIIEKIVDPAWYVPASIKTEKPDLPPVVPPGPENPMGNRALRLSAGDILIHGTNRPWGIGTRNTHGCIRLYPEDIVRLFGLIQKGERVTIVDEPVKIAVQGDAIYMEVHDYEDGRDLYHRALTLLAERNLTARVDLDKVRKSLKERSGLPVNVAKGRPVTVADDR